MLYWLNPLPVAQSDYSLSSYSFNLPPEKIAQNPVEPRDHSQLLVVDSVNTFQHRVFKQLPELLRPGDLLVLNNTRVIPARLYGIKPEGAQVEILLLEPLPDDRWKALVKPGRRLKPGAWIHFGEGPAPELTAQVIANDPATGGRVMAFQARHGTTVEAAISRLGKVPFPPYITNSQAQPEQYQTIYAETPGAIAAPTAGLHFTPELFERLHAAGISWAKVTLHVGVGTFRPVEAEDITTHTMHQEWVEVPEGIVEQIRHTKANGGRIVAVGTTVTRALEGAAAGGELCPLRGETNLFIYPGYRWRVIDGLITNFHLPGSSLLMLVSALIGRQRLLELYQVAISANYRFYSFGDAMLILPEAVAQT